MGNNSHNLNGNFGKTEPSNHRYDRTMLGENGRNINGNVVDGADLKASGFWDK